MPRALADSLRTFPADVAAAWVESLPKRLSAAEERWAIEIGRPFDPGGVTSFVAPAKSLDGSTMVYKITVPHDESRFESHALAAYGGDGAVRLIAGEPPTFEYLLEHARPGHDLWTVDDDSTRLDVACGLMTRLWRAEVADEIRSLRTTAEAWAAVTERRLITHELSWIAGPVERGIGLLRTLPVESEEKVLLHGDFHPGNILAAEREPWLAIDPKPLAGDPAFEPVQLLTQYGGRIAEPPSVAKIERRLGSIAECTGLDAERIGRWAIARTAEWSMWSWDHGDTIDAAIAYTWARALDPLLED